MSRSLVLLFLVGCAHATDGRPKIGECEMPADVERHVLIGCVAFLPAYTEASCIYLGQDTGHGPELMTLRTEACGDWSVVYQGPLIGGGESEQGI